MIDAILIDKVRNHDQHSPFLMGIGGSVAVGKSTLAENLTHTFIAAGFQTVRVSTDNFLYSNELLKEKNLSAKKGFPESYDKQALIDFLINIRKPGINLSIPIYSHEIYDIHPEKQTLTSPQVLIVEGVNTLAYSDYFDVTLFLDAPMECIKTWYLNRFHQLRHRAASDSSNHFYPYSQMTHEEAETFALSVWKKINEPNLLEHILPLKYRADFILEKASSHKIIRVVHG